MSNLYTERVLSVHHWNDTLFSFRPPATRVCASRPASSVIGLKSTVVR